MSETFCNTLSMRPDHVRYGSCGAPLAGVETKVLDRDGAPAPAGEAGVLWLKHPTLAQRYHRDEHNTKAFNDGWFCTNDQFRVELDEAGNPHWFHEGRADELLKIAGQWVKPSEVEEVALSYVSQAGDTIKEAACIVVTDASGFERLALYVVPAQAGISDAALAQSLRPTLEAKLPSHSLPRWIRGIDELPRTPTGKVQRFKLKAGFVVD